MSLKNRSRNRWVNQLIIPNTNEWNRPLIHSLFHEFDALEICKIRIPSIPVDDVLAWNHEKDGNFTVRSAYNLGLNLKNSTGWEKLSHSHGNGRVSLWNLIWKAHIPHKVRIFAWRVATDSLPTKENKLKRTLEHDSICNICGREPEDAHHAIVHCSNPRAPREAMREVRPLPKEECFARSRPVWLHNYLANVTTSPEIRSC